MPDSAIFISHASQDDPFVKELREALEDYGLIVWVDSRNLRGGAKLAPEIDDAIEQARQVIVVLSPNTINSPWVRKEIQKALETEQRRQGDGYRVIPLLLPGVEPSALALWFDEEPLGVRVEVKPGGLSEALPQILAALGERLPDDKQSMNEPPSRPVAELKLKLKGASLEEVGEGKRRVKATAQLIYDPADSARPAADSREFSFTAPLGPIEADDLRWYLERYYLWPTGVFTERAKHIAEQLPQWGRALYDAATEAQSARELLADWQQTAEGIERRFSILVDSRLLEGSSSDEQAAANEAASALLALPWELMHDGRTFLFQGKNPVRVRRCLPKERAEKAIVSSLPIRILLLSPRPEDERAGYIDHRLSARPLLDAVESLGELAELTFLNPPTFPALQQALRKAADVGEPFDVIHFDGHGVYNRERGLGALCFEDPQDSDKTEKRQSQLIDAEKLAGVVREHRIPLVFLEACQSASEERPTASVAAKLLDEGVTSVVAMTHSVLVETARRFVTTFYRELAEGKRIGTAMLAGQHALYNDDFRFRVMGAGELRLQDWFVPVLYQEENDPRLVTRLLPEQVQILHANRRRLSLGALPEPPAHSFIGRSRELLALERLLQIQTSPEQSYAVVRGQGGEGKTTLAVELARWMVRTNRFRRAAFVTFDPFIKGHCTDARGVLIKLGQQLLPEGNKFHVGPNDDLEKARQPVERALNDHPTLIVLDNLESLLDLVRSTGFSRNELEAENLPPEGGTTNEIFDLCLALLRAHPATRIVFTSREPLPSPFDHRQREIGLGALSRDDAIELVSQVMKSEGREPKQDDAGNTPQEVAELVEAVGCHARALTLLAREMAQRGVRATTAVVQQLMAEMDRHHPGDRENSLYASVELSLRRLPPEMREQIKALGVFHGGFDVNVLRLMLDVDEETVAGLARRLIGVALAEAMAYSHLRLDPALPLYLLREMGAAEQETARTRWAKAMRHLVAFLYEQLFQNAELCAQMTQLELPNIMAMLTWAGERDTPEEVVDLAASVEQLLARLGHPQALALATLMRKRAARKLGEWNNAQYLNASASIDRLLEQGQLQVAYEAAQQLLKRCLSEGEDAYARSAYDIAGAYFKLGRVLEIGGDAENALPLLAKSLQLFQKLADAGDISSERMTYVAIAESADCLTDLGQLGEAVKAYEESIRRAEEFNDQEAVAIAKGQLGIVRRQQRRYAEALELYFEARRIYERLGDPRKIAAIWHQIGNVYKDAEQFDQAEQAYRRSLALRAQQKDILNEAHTLGELGSLYAAVGRLEQAVNFYRQAADIYIRLKDQRYEGVSHSNLGIALFQLQRYDEARQELLRAIECKEPYGHAAEPWKTWITLSELEQAAGHAAAAAQARQQSIRCYLAYRRDGGESQQPGGQLCALVYRAVQQGKVAEAEVQLTVRARADAPAWLTALLPKLQAILRGDRDPTLAADPQLDFDDAAELQLLLEALGS